MPIDPKDYKKTKVAEYGTVSGATNMKKEILARGPITCGIAVTNNFYDNYQRGDIWSEDIWFPQINHAIAVVGWGNYNGEEYWVVRNSWGVSWGDRGYFYMKMHSDNLGIETSCNWAVPVPNF